MPDIKHCCLFSGPSATLQGSTLKMPVNGFDQVLVIIEVIIIYGLYAAALLINRNLPGLILICCL